LAVGGWHSSFLAILFFLFHHVLFFKHIPLYSLFVSTRPQVFDTTQRSAGSAGRPKQLNNYPVLFFPK
jgi:hypothetical protein